MKEYMRLTPKDLIEVINSNDRENINFLNYAIRLHTLEDKIENGTLIEKEIVKPNCIIDKEKIFIDFICQKCNSTVSFVEAGVLNLIDKSDLSNAQKLESIEQLYPNYCSYCGAKLKELNL